MPYKEGLISVVIPTHNRQDLIERAVCSVQRQTYPNIEIIVVSDGSTDATAEVMKTICENDCRVSFIEYHPNKGGNHARNTGIRAANGEWVAFLDDDDEWYNDKLEKQMQIVKENKNIGLVCTGINAIYDVDNTSSVYIPKVAYDSSREILLGNTIGSTTTVMVRHDILDECGMFDEDLMAKQDFDLWIRVCQITKIGVVREPCVKYHNLAQNNQISWNYEKYAKATEYIEKKYKDLYEANLSKQEMKRVCANNMFSIARKAMKTNDGKVARKYIKKSLKYKVRPIVIMSWFASFLPFEVINKVNIFIKKK